MGRSLVRMDSANYEKIFGHTAPLPPQESSSGSTVFMVGVIAPRIVTHEGTAIHADSRYRTKYDPGLGVGYDGASERKRILERINNAREAKGEGKIRERG